MVDFFVVNDNMMIDSVWFVVIYSFFEELFYFCLVIDMNVFEVFRK